MFREFVSYYKPQRKMFALDMAAAFLVALIDLVYPISHPLMLNDYIQTVSSIPC